METTPRAVIDSVVRSVCGRQVEGLVRLTRGGLNEAYCVELFTGAPVIVRIARHPVPWFTVVERGADFLRDEVMTRPAPRLSLAHGDFLPKHLMIDERGTIVGVIDWEFAGPASPAYDIAHWEVSAGGGLHDRSDLVRLGYARVADPEAADAGWVPAFAIDFALDVLSWRNPAPPERLRRCVNVITRSVGG